MLTDRNRDVDGSSPEEAVAPGRVLRGRFVLEEEIEHGRLGLVFRAEDRQRAGDDGGGRPVAILILPAEVVRNPRQLETFKREFASVQALSHPNIVSLYDFDRDGDTYFVVMELVDGESLRNIVDSLDPELLSENESLDVVRAVGEALLYAHASGIVHGDVRAENVIVTARHEIKLMFVSACLARSAPFSVDPRDDVYGLASLAYQLLSGEIPPATGLQRAGGRHRTSEPPRIKGLTRSRWNALRSGLAPRDKRSRSIRQFLAGIGVPERELPRPPRSARRPAAAERSGVAQRILQRAAIAAVVMGAVVAIVFGVLQVGVDRIAELPALLARSGEQTPAEPAASSATERTASESSSSEEAAGAASGSPSSEAETGPTPAPAQADAGEAAAAFEEETIEVASPQIVEAPTANEPTLPGPAADEIGAGDETGAADEVQARASEPSGAQQAGSGEADAREVDASSTAAAAEASQPGGQVLEGAFADASSVANGAATSAPASPTPALAFARREIVATEGQGIVAVEIVRPDPSGRLSAIWWTSDGTARATDDYADFGRVVEGFTDGERTRTIFIPITSDALVEDREYFYVNLSALSSNGAQEGELLTATITIVDDD